MSLRLLLDEDSQAQLLIKLLIAAGHNVVTINEVGLAGSLDEIVLDYARGENRIVLTHNCDDFEDLHQFDPKHPGILAIYRDANRSKDMSFKAIVRAIANLEISGIPLTNQFIALNHWNY